MAYPSSVLQNPFPFLSGQKIAEAGAGFGAEPLATPAPETGRKGRSIRF
jgi:hypothetical protein